MGLRAAHCASPARGACVAAGAGELWDCDGASTDLRVLSEWNSMVTAAAAIYSPLTRRRSAATTGIITGVTSTPTRPQTATISVLLGAAGRKTATVPIRRTFVQQGTQRAPKPGPLQAIVTRHDETALDLFLLHRALASSDPWDVTRDARIWGRALGHGSDVDGGASIVSKAWRRLDE